MFSAPLERLSGSRATGGASLTLAVLSGYTIISAVVAGAFAVPAGLFVLVLGGVATMIVDHALWREAAFASPEAGDARDRRSPELLEAAPAAVALPAPDPEPRSDEPRRPAGRRRKAAPAPEA